MKKLFFCIIILLVSSLCFAGDMTVKTWRKSSLNYRISLANRYIKDVSGTYSMAKAEELQRCMWEATDDPRLYTMKIDDIAVSCMVMMGYK